MIHRSILTLTLDLPMSPAISPYDCGEVDDDDGGSHHDRDDDGFFSSPQAVEHSLQAGGKINCTTSASLQRIYMWLWSSG